MRAVDVEPIRAALAAHSEHAARESERFKRVSAWRERLIAEGPTALAELARWRPDLDRAQWERRGSAPPAGRRRAPSPHERRPDPPSGAPRTRAVVDPWGGGITSFPPAESGPRAGGDAR